MRRKFVYLCAVMLIFALTSCSKGKYEEDIVSESTTVPSETESAITDNEIAVTESQHEISTETVNTHVLEYDEDYFDINTNVSQSAMLPSHIAVSDKGIYIINNVINYSNEFAARYRLVYYDFQTMTARPWCNRVDCSHNTDECAAIFSSAEYCANYVFYNDCYVYLVGRDEKGTYLVRYDEDGSNETVIGKLWEENSMVFIDQSSGAETGGSYDFPYIVLHNGRAYYIVNTLYEKYDLYCISLEPGSEAEFLCTIDSKDEDSEALVLNGIQISEDVLYIVMYKRISAFNSDYEYKVRAYAFDTVNEQLKIVSEELKQPTDITVRGNDLYYSGKDGLMCYSWENVSNELIMADTDYNNNGSSIIYSNYVGKYFVMDGMMNIGEEADKPCVKVYDCEADRLISEIRLYTEYSQDRYRGCDGRFIYLLRTYTDELDAHLGLDAEQSFSGKIYTFIDLRTLEGDEWSEYLTTCIIE